MTPSELAQHLATLAPLGLSKPRLAALWGYASHSSIYQMLAGKQRVPEPMAAWLRELAAWWEQHRRAMQADPPPR